jgi:ribosome-interacting GTPase 1
MPTNLPPDYFEVEKRFRAAASVSEKIALLEEMMSLVPKHKGTDHLRADLRRKLSRLKTSPQGKKGAGRRAVSFYVHKEGAGQVAVIGPTNVGKSALVAALTHAEPEVSSVPYTTWQPLPGMMLCENIQVQLVDTPPIDRSFIEPELLNLIRRVDLVFLVVDLQFDPLDQFEEAIDLLIENRIVPLNLADRYPHEGRTAILPFVIVANKDDDFTIDENFHIFCDLLEQAWLIVPVSAITGRGLDRLRQLTLEQLNVIRVYTRAPGREPDLTRPFVLKSGDTVETLAGRIHKDFINNLKTVRIWGKSVYDGQLVQKDYVLQDGDIVELHL